VIAEGPPEDVAKAAGSHTGRYLKPVLDAHAREAGKAQAAGSKAGRARKVASDLLG